MRPNPSYHNVDVKNKFLKRTAHSKFEEVLPHIKN